jgi:hypothetical protein
MSTTRDLPTAKHEVNVVVVVGEATWKVVVERTVVRKAEHTQ